MKAMVELLVRREGTPPQIQIGRAAARLGRSPSNDIIVDVARVSWHHAVLWCESDALWVRDTGSTNGVKVNGKRIETPTQLSVGDVVSLGATEAVRVASLTGAAPPTTLVRDLATGVSLAVRGTLRIGNSPLADLRVEEGDLTVHLDDDGVWLETADGLDEVPHGTTFSVGERQFIVEHGADARVATREVVPNTFPIRISTTLNGVTGPEAQLTDLDGHSDPLLVSADNAAVLLHLLVQQLESDREAGVANPGWRSDSDLNSGIWGRRGELDPNAIHVVIYRLRKEFEAAGYDPRCIQKSRRRTRLRVAEVATR